MQDSFFKELEHISIKISVAVILGILKSMPRVFLMHPSQYLQLLPSTLWVEILEY